MLDNVLNNMLDNMLDIYLCEDDEKQRTTVKAIIKNHCAVRNIDAKILASPYPAEILEAFASAYNPALFFLDIDLNNKMNGIELAALIRATGKKACIVFLTTHSEMTQLIFQYKVEALDFIVKDCITGVAGASRFSGFSENVEIKSEIKNRIEDCIDTALQRFTNNTNETKIKIHTDEKIILLNPDEIICIESTHIKHKLRLHTQNRIIEFRAELKAMEAQLNADKRFLRCHKSFIINRDKIGTINKADKTVAMINGCICALSRAGRRLVEGC